MTSRQSCENAEVDTGSSSSSEESRVHSTPNSTLFSPRAERWEALSPRYRQGSMLSRGAGRTRRRRRTVQRRIRGSPGRGRRAMSPIRGSAATSYRARRLWTVVEAFEQSRSDTSGTSSDTTEVLIDICPSLAPRERGLPSVQYFLEPAGVVRASVLWNLLAPMLFGFPSQMGHGRFGVDIRDKTVSLSTSSTDGYRTTFCCDYWIDTLYRLRQRVALCNSSQKGFILRRIDRLILGIDAGWEACVDVFCPPLVRCLK